MTTTLFSRPTVELITKSDKAQQRNHLTSNTTASVGAVDWSVDSPAVAGPSGRQGAGREFPSLTKQVYCTQAWQSEPSRLGSV